MPGVHIPEIGAFLLGAPKCGTNWLSDVLSQHPNICISNPKEPDVVATHKGTFNRDFSDPDYSKYHQYFHGPGVKIDCSVHAFSCPEAPKRIQKIWPKSRLIVSLRDPYERTESHWNHALDFADDKRAGVSWDDFLTAWEDGRLSCDTLYGRSLQRWLRHFSLDSFLIVDSHRMRSEPHTVLEEICKHVDAGAFDFDLRSIRNANLGSQRRPINILGKSVRSIASLVPGKLKNRVVTGLERRGVNIYKTRLLSKKIQRRRMLSEYEKDMIRDVMEDDQSLLESLTGFRYLV